MTHHDVPYTPSLKASSLQRWNTISLFPFWYKENNFLTKQTETSHSSLGKYFSLWLNFRDVLKCWIFHFYAMYGIKKYMEVRAQKTTFFSCSRSKEQLVLGSYCQSLTCLTRQNEDPNGQPCLQHLYNFSHPCLRKFNVTYASDFSAFLCFVRTTSALYLGCRGRAEGERMNIFLRNLLL